jgi:hypothetical protein
MRASQQTALSFQRQKCRTTEYLTVEFQHPNSNLQSHCGVAHCDAVLHANIVSDASFKLLDQWTVISQPPAVQNAIDPCEDGGTIAKIRAANVQWRFESRWVAQYR